MMTLATYLNTSKVSQAAFAERVGVKQPTVNRWVNGQKPSWEAAALIEKETGGAVPVAVWAGSQSLSPTSAPLSEAS